LDFANLHFFHYPLPNKLFNFCQKIFHFPKLEKIAAEFFPNKQFVKLILPNINFFATDLPYWQTFHDLSFVVYPKFYSLKSRLWHFLLNAKKIARKAELLLAVSDHTKQDLQNIWQISKEKIFVKYPEQKNLFLKNDATPREKIALFVGTIEKRKNLLNLINVFNNFNESYLNYKLILVGKTGFGSAKIFNAGKNNKNIIFKNYLSENDLTELYQAAEFFIFPSFYEGFGLPLAEAMFYGLPILASANTAITEIVGQAGLLFNTFDNNQLKNFWLELASDENLRAELSTKSKQRYLEIAQINKAQNEELKNILTINSHLCA